LPPTSSRPIGRQHPPACAGGDPRVRYTEAERIVAAVRKNGVPVWYLLAENEGHGFARKVNADYLFYAMIVFFQERLAKP